MPRKFLDKLRLLFRSAQGRREISDLLAQARPDASLEDRVAWLIGVVRWVREEASHQHGFNRKTGRLQTVRVRFLLHILDRNPQWKSSVAATLRSIIEETSALELFCRIGLAQERGLAAEAFARLRRKWVPRPPREKNIGEWFVLLFPEDRDAVWVENLPPDLVGAIRRLAAFGSAQPPLVFQSFRSERREALAILGAHLASLGAARPIRARLPHLPIASSPFLELNRLLGNILADKSPDPRLVRGCALEASRCRQAIQDVFAHLEQSGVSVALVYDLENGLSALRRIEILLGQMVPQPELAGSAVIASFTALLIRESHLNRTLSDLVRVNLHLISRKIVERAGATGEHYITRTRAGYYTMVRSGAGGGFLTIGTTLGKFALAKIGAAPFFEGFLSSLNYAGSFVLLQLLGFTLATKQPSMTASALAGKLKKYREGGDEKEFVDEVARITRSQFAAAVGNIGMAVPVALAVDIVSQALFGRHVLDLHYSQHVIESVDPLHSLTVPLAALTGVLLWASSLFAGGIENWFVFHQLPEAIARHRRLGKAFGAERARRLSAWCLHNIGALGGNVSLGCLLAFTPVIGRLFGLPLDVRHVTLSSASLTFALSSAFGAGAVSWQAFIAPCLGIAVIGVLNFGVSFALALFVATRARNVEAAAVVRLMGAVGERFRRSPREFFYPVEPRDVTTYGYAKS